MSFIETRKKKPLYLVCGICCSGKTSFASYLSKRYGYEIIGADESQIDVDRFLTGDDVNLYTSSPYAEEFVKARNGKERVSIVNKWVAAECMMRVYTASKQDDGIILDARMSNIESRKILVDFNDVCIKNLSLSAYWMDTDLDECLKRFRNRHDHAYSVKPADTLPVLTEDNIKHDHKTSVKPSKKEGFENVFYVKAISPDDFDITNVK